MKRKITAAAAVVICLSILAYGTTAFYTAEEKAHNVITTGNIDIELLEWADDDRQEEFPENGIDGVMPGTEVTKIVEVKNTGSGDAWIRIKVEPSITLAEGVQGETDLSLISFDLNDTDWTRAEDGYFYYNRALASGEVTAPLFTSVKFAADMGNLYQNSTAAVDVEAFATQTANNGSTVWEASGWPAE